MFNLTLENIFLIAVHYFQLVINLKFILIDLTLNCRAEINTKHWDQESPFMRRDPVKFAIVTQRVLA